MSTKLDNPPTVGEALRAVCGTKVRFFPAATKGLYRIGVRPKRNDGVPKKKQIRNADGDGYFPKGVKMKRARPNNSLYNMFRP